jgi:hypothetical protein
MTATDRTRCRRSWIDADGLPGLWAALSSGVQGNPRPWRRMGPPGGHRKSNQHPPALGPIPRGYVLRTDPRNERQNRQGATSDCLVARERTTGVESSKFCSVGSTESWAKGLPTASADETDARLVRDQEVAGSNPVTPTARNCLVIQGFGTGGLAAVAASNSGQNGCTTPVQRLTKGRHAQCLPTLERRFGAPPSPSCTKPAARPQ